MRTVSLEVVFRAILGLHNHTFYHWLLFRLERIVGRRRCPFVLSDFVLFAGRWLVAMVCDSAGSDTRKFDRALILGDAASLRSQGYPDAALVVSGDLQRVICGEFASSLSVRAALEGDIVGPCLPRYIGGVALLHAFIRENWCGPRLKDDGSSGDDNEDMLLTLERDGEDVARSAHNAGYLTAARYLLVDSVQEFMENGFVFAPWWAARVVLAHNALLSAPTPSLQKELFKFFGMVLGKDGAGSLHMFPALEAEVSSDITEDDDQLLPQPMPEGSGTIEDEEDSINCVFDGHSMEETPLMVLAYVELALAQKAFYDAEAAAQSVAKATRIARLRVKVSGELGVRTKHQRKPTAQLVARAFQLYEQSPATTTVVGHSERCRTPFTALAACFPNRSSCDGSHDSDSDTLRDVPLPKNVPVHDSDVLGYIKLSSSQEQTSVGRAEAGKDGTSQICKESVAGVETDVDAPADAVHPAFEISDLTPLDQALVLAHASVVGARNADHLLTDQQMAPYVNLVLANEKSCYGTTSLVLIKALLLRVSFESDRGRYLERCMSQMEEISKFVDSSMDDVPETTRYAAVAERALLSFATSVPPCWELKKQLAISLGKVGLVKSAMEIFKQLEFWDELVDCHRLIGNLGAAETLVKDQLSRLDKAVEEAVDDQPATDGEGRRTRSKRERARAVRSARRPRLLCVLGDITRDLSHFETAWQESNGHYSRAKRALGRACAERGLWREAVVHFKAALTINPLYPETWFTYGCAAMAIEDMQLAAEAFTHVIQQTPENGEGWNNLGRVLYELGRKKEALRALSEAARLKRDSWRVWNNVLLLATELRSTIDILRAMERLLELRGRDAVVDRPLSVAVNEVGRLASSAKKEDHAEAAPLAKRMLAVLGQATSMVSTNAAVWGAYAELHELVPNTGGARKGFECRLKQVRSINAKAEWTREHRGFRDMIMGSVALCSDAITVGDMYCLRAAASHVESVLQQTSERFGEDAGFAQLKQVQGKVLAALETASGNTTSQ